jgi:hypothetical protein
MEGKSMEVQEIDVFIEKNGQVRVEVRGVKGMSCLDMTKDLEDALGGEVAERKMHHEAHETTQETVQEQQRQPSIRNPK